MLDSRFRHLVVSCILDLMEKDDLGFLLVEDLTVSHQPDRIRLSELERNTLEGEVIINHSVKVSTMNSKGLNDILHHQGKDEWFDVGEGEDDWIIGTMKCLGLLVEQGIKIVRSVKMDTRKENLTVEGYGDPRTKTSLFTSFNWIVISKDDLERKVRMIFQEERDRPYG